MFHVNMPDPNDIDWDKVDKDKAKVRGQLDSAWLMLAPYAPAMQRIVCTGMCQGALDGQLVKEAMTLLVGELNYRAQEALELTIRHGSSRGDSSKNPPSE